MSVNGQNLLVLPKPSVAQFCSLFHPKYLKLTRFVILDGEQLCEIQRHMDGVEQPVSWIVNSQIQTDGALYVASRVDPLFYVLAALQKSRNMTSESAGVFCNIHEILFGPLALLLPLVSERELDSICDIKHVDVDVFVRLNEIKLMYWLQAKVSRVQEYLLASAGSVDVDTASATSSSFMCANLKPTLPDLSSQKSAHGHSTEFLKAKLVTAIGLVGEYLSNEMFLVLADKYELTIDEVMGRRKAIITSSVDAPSTSVRSIRDASDLLPDSFDAQNQKRIAEQQKKAKSSESTVALKRLAKTDVRGMNKMSSFFSKK